MPRAATQLGAGEFNPAKYLTKVSGADYLEVKWRIVWLREKHPDAQVITEVISHDLVNHIAVVKATIFLPDEGCATGYGMEERSDFRDYLEKAETKAIGRALAALGFGTQFCDDHEFGAAQGKVVDSPVNLPPGNLPPGNLPPGNLPVNTNERAELLTQCTLEKDRVGASVCREWALKNTPLTNPMLSALSDTELHNLLQYTKTLPDREVVES